MTDYLLEQLKLQAASKMERAKRNNARAVRRSLGKPYAVKAGGIVYRGEIETARADGAGRFFEITLRCGEYVHGPFKTKYLPK